DGERRRASFVGFLPADEPRLAILVAVDEPEGEVYGGAVAAPAWSAIAAQALRQIGVAPDSAREELALASVAPALEDDPASEADGEGETQRPPADGRQPGQSVAPDPAGPPARSAV